MLLDGRERAYLSDFGLIRATRINTEITKTGSSCEPSTTWPPEQIKRPVSGRVAPVTLWERTWATRGAGPQTPPITRRCQPNLGQGVVDVEAGRVSPCPPRHQGSTPCGRATVRCDEA